MSQEECVLSENIHSYEDGTRCGETRSVPEIITSYFLRENASFSIRACCFLDPFNLPMLCQDCEVKEEIWSDYLSNHYCP